MSLAFSYSDPPWKFARSTNDLNNVVGYSHTIEAVGGFKSAEITCQVGQTEIDDWLEYGLGRNIEVIGNTTVFSGFVNMVEASMGTLSVIRGPLTNIENSVILTYTPILNAHVNPHVLGVRSETIAAEDADSQSKYGVLEGVYSYGNLLDDGVTDQAAYIRDAILLEKNEPESSETISIMNPNVPTLILHILGYEAFLDKYYYVNALTGTTQIPTKLIAILAAEPNGIFSTNYDGIATAAAYLQLTPAGVHDYEKARKLVNDILAVGDANNARTLFGIYEDRRAYYAIVPTRVVYNHRIASTNPNIEDPSGVTIYPWDVRPGQWVFLPDFLPGRNTPSVRLRSDPRFILIEKVSYNMPWDLSINGSKIRSAKQLLIESGFGA